MGVLCSPPESGTLMSKRILVATDLPYWRRSTGAYQRISSLVRRMTDAGFVVRTFYIGANSAEDRRQVDEQGLDVRFYSSDRPPQNMSWRVSWWIKSVLHQMFGAQRQSSSDRSMTLDDFRWPWAVTAFSECVDEFQPSSIICQYVKTAYLLEGLTKTQRGETLCAIDTHDVQHLRAKQFLERSAKHWLSIDREQETEVLSRFDLIIAIQEQEAEVFRKMAPKSKVVVCGHCSEPGDSNSDSTVKASGDPLSVGYIASANEANFDAIKGFLIDGWIPSEEKIRKCQLIIAGDICKSLADDPECRMAIEKANSRVKLIDRVDLLADFYGQVDVVINPIQFGAGLKIKNCEALDFGKPLITTSHGAAGMPNSLKKVTVIVDTHAETIDLIADWSNDRESLNSQNDLVLNKRPDRKTRSEIYENFLDLLN